MSVWLTIPSARPVEEAAPVLAKWRERGYKIALWRDDEASLAAEYSIHPDHATRYGWTIKRETDQDWKYPGYAVAVNKLIRAVMSFDPDAEWFISAGDDVSPDPFHTAEEIAKQCGDHFGGRIGELLNGVERDPNWRTFGVMQPTGDRWGTPERPGKPARAYIDHVAGSAWIGREFARRAYQGNGPLWHEYFHMGVDEELQKVAIKYGVFWQRPDLTHFHQHWGRPREGERYGDADRMPDFLVKANSPEEWHRYKALLAAREAAGFPRSELL